MKFSFQTTRSGCMTYRVDCGERESVCVCVCVFVCVCVCVCVCVTAMQIPLEGQVLKI